jgi:hypothetical protein
VVSSLIFPTTTPSGSRPHYRGFTITLRHTTHGRTPLGSDGPVAEIPTRTIHNILKRQTSKLPAGFEPAIPASEGPENDALDGAATGISSVIVENVENHEGFRSGRRFVGGSSKQALPCYKPVALQLEATSAVLL